MKAKLDQFIPDYTSKVLINPQHRKFDYSDGIEIENEIYRILLEAEDKSMFSKELNDAIVDWPTEYHFSVQRHNLLRHLFFKDSDRILELGAGCGAITRQFGESGAEVTAIEGSPIRARCAAVRCQDLPNVNIYCSDFQQIEFTEKFDYVTLIGVLEYCNIFFKENDDPFAACLGLVQSVLKKDGKLILAIENRLGLKYFMGYSEDHTGIRYFGIQDLYTQKTAKTLGREELRASLIGSGFCNIEFQYPFPDYKITSAVFSEQAFNTNGFDAGKIIGQFRSRDYLIKEKPPFSENLVWSQLSTNKLISSLSNSFLVIAGLESIAHEEQDSLLAVVYCVDRKNKYNTETKFLLSQIDGIRVIKRPLFPEETFNSQLIELKPWKGKYFDGIHVGSEMMKKLQQDDSQGFFSLCNLWVDYIRQNGLQENTNGSNDSLIKPEFIDCIPDNLILNENSLEYIDREWWYLKHYTLEMLITRGLYQFQTKNGLGDFLISIDSVFGKIINEWLMSIGINLDKPLINKFVEAENSICDEVYGEGIWQPVRGLRSRIYERAHIRFVKKVKRFIWLKFLSRLKRFIKRLIRT